MASPMAREGMRKGCRSHTVGKVQRYTAAENPLSRRISLDYGVLQIYHSEVSRASEAQSLGSISVFCLKCCGRSGDLLEAGSSLQCTDAGFSLAILFLLIPYHFTSPYCISIQLLLFMLYKLVRQILRS